MIIRISRISATIPHAELIFRTVIKKLWTFFGLGVEIARSHRYVEKRQTNTAIHGLTEDVTATA